MPAQSKAPPGDCGRRQSVGRSTPLYLVAALLVPIWAMAQGPKRDGLQRTMRSVREIGQLDNSDAKHAYPVQLEGVVTYADPEWGLLFLEDSTGGIYIDVHGMKVSLPAGTRLRVDAVTGPGDIAPVLVAPKIRALGQRDLPRPQVRTVAELDTGVADSRWVSTRGVLRPGNQNWNRIHFRIFDGKAWAMVVIPHDDSPAARRLVGAVVRVRGVSGVRLDPNGKRLGAQIFVTRLEDIEVEEASLENPFASPPQPIARLLGGAGDERFVRRAHVGGTVTWRMPGYFLMADAPALHLSQPMPPPHSSECPWRWWGFRILETMGSPCPMPRYERPPPQGARAMLCRAWFRRGNSCTIFPTGRWCDSKHA